MSKKPPKSKYRDTSLTLAESESIHKLALDATVGKARVKDSSTSADKRETMELDDTFEFGKYKEDRTLLYVLEHDPTYISWLLDNEVVHISQEAHKLIQDIEDNPYG